MQLQLYMYMGVVYLEFIQPFHASFFNLTGQFHLNMTLILPFVPIILFCKECTARSDCVNVLSDLVPHSRLFYPVHGTLYTAIYFFTIQFRLLTTMINKPLDHIVGKGEIAGNQHFLLSLTMSSSLSKTDITI